ncbi:LuxR family transcriptional regulator, partial [Kitasatospora sp. MBT63]|uniref:helix-turn-helix transcriptional regulator n=1 Tax=Kitasatospora sp. MBT63 TaxID=1444768 RepID=UPI00053965B9
MESAYAEFVGRGTELTTVAECAARAAQGAPCLVMVEGEAGIGKSALVRKAVTGLEGFSQYWATCDPAEQDYRFGVVEQLLRRVPQNELHGYPLLPRATEGAAPVEVGSELIRLLGALEAHGPVALVVDDVQWIDEASMGVLKFLVRRWWTERILLVATNRTAPPGLPTGIRRTDEKDAPERLVAAAEHAVVVSLAGLDRAEVIQLARASGAPDLDTGAADRLRDHTGGHPLYLRSLFTQASIQDLADPHSTLPVPDSLAATVRQILAGLNHDSRGLVEALAVLDAQVPLAVAAEVAGVDHAATALEPALASGLVEWWPESTTTPLRLRHNLQRTAIYEAISPPRRHQLHAAAVPLVDTNASWAHRVAATDHSDAALADELHTEAERQATAGRGARAATLLLWAADLSENRTIQEHRLLAATTHLLQANDYQRGYSLQQSIQQCAPSAARSTVLGRLAFGRGDFATAEDLLTRAVQQADEHEDTEAAALALIWLGGVYVWQSRGADALTPLRRALELGPSNPQTVGYAEYLWVLASEWIDGAAPTLRGFEARNPGLPMDAEAVELHDSVLLRARSIARGAMGHLGGATQDLVTLTKRQRDGLVVDVRATDHFMLASHQYWSGLWEEAVISAERALGLAATNGPLSGRAPGQAVTAMVAAGQGRWQAAEEHCRASHDAAKSSALFSDAIYPALAEAVLAQARDDPDGMFRALQPVHDGPQTGSMYSWRLIWLPLFAQGQIGVGRLDEAARTLLRIRELDVPSLQVGIRWLEGLLAEGRQDPGAAERWYREGVDLPAAPDDMPLHRALIEHAYGRLLLATGKAGRAAERLRAARSRYDALGAVPFSQRVEQELAAVGAPTGVRSPLGDLAQLTERERAVAHLAAQGMTNQEIAKELYVSAKT